MLVFKCLEEKQQIIEKEFKYKTINLKKKQLSAQIYPWYLRIVYKLNVGSDFIN